MPVKKQDFRSAFLKPKVIELMGQRIKMKNYTIRLDMEFKAAFDDMVEWEKKVSQLDAETLCQSLYLLMADEEQAKLSSWEELLDIIPGDQVTRIKLVVAISKIIGESMPQITEAALEIEKKLDATIKTQLKKMNPKQKRKR